MDVWLKDLNEILSKNHNNAYVHFIPFGNNFRSDDGVGIYIVNKLRKKLRNNKPSFIKIHTVKLNLESLFRNFSKDDLLIIFDAVQVNAPPGTVVFTGMPSAKFGFFGTHNIPLRLILEYQSILERSYLLGIVPHDLSIGEELSPVVRKAADEVVDLIYRSIIRWSS